MAHGRNGFRSGRNVPVGPIVFAAILLTAGGAFAYRYSGAPRPAPARPTRADPQPEPVAPVPPPRAEPVAPQIVPQTAAPVVAPVKVVVQSPPAPEPEPEPVVAPPQPEPLPPPPPPAPPQLAAPQVAGQWKLVWSDEFDVNGAPDAAKWDYEVGFVRNGELQYYTKDRRENARVEGGTLVIEARKERYKNPGFDPNSRDWNRKREYAEYTAASLTTRSTASWTYGRIEVRAKLPTGRGTWPAIWMLGTNISQAGWPTCGEIDIMENVGYDPDGVHTTVHTRDYNHTKGTGRGNRITLARPYADFHTYAVEWSENVMAFVVDGTRVFSVANDGTGVGAWPFDKPEYLILNFAVGGGWGAVKGVDESIWPQTFHIDYVRVYQRTGSSPLRKPERATATAPGLASRYYEGTWDKLPDFAALRAVRTGTSPAFDIAARNRNDQFGFLFEGFFTAPRDGSYVFLTESDDGSRLWIGDELLAENDGLHGMRAVGGEIALAAGLHPIRVAYFDNGGGEGLVVKYRGPGIDLAPVPASALSHRTGR